MNTKVRPRKTRVYRSLLRDERATQTKERILDGLVQVLSRNGIADLSIPLIAKEARVSIPSVYRYFPTKKHLIEALDEYAHRKGGFSFSELLPATTPDELAGMIPALFKRREAIEPTIAAALRTRIGYDLRQPALADRARYFSTALEPAAKHLGRKEKAWLTEVVFVLTSFGAVRAFKDYLGLDTDEAAERVAWAIRTLARGATAPPSKKSK